MGSYKDNYDQIVWSFKPKKAKERPNYGKNRSDLPSPHISGDYKAYACPITGNIIDGKREHNANLEKHGCRIHEKGEFEDVKKHGQNRINAEMDKAIDKSVDAIATQIDF